MVKVDESVELSQCHLPTMSLRSFLSVRIEGSQSLRPFLGVGAPQFEKIVLASNLIRILDKRHI